MMTYTLKIGLIFLLSLSIFANDYSVRLHIERPKSCPVREDIATYAEILGKLQSIRNSLGTNCEKEAQDQIENLNQNLSGLESVANDAQIGSDEEQTAQVTQAFSTLGAIAAKSECYYNIRERGLVPVVADVLMDLSQVGLLIPNDETIAYSTTGYFLGTSLKILISVFKQRFDFENESDRKNFLDLNCAFFDVRRAIDDSGFLLSQSQIIINERDTIKEELPKLEEEKNLSKKSLDSFEAFYQEQRKKYLTLEIGSSVLDLEKTIHTLRPKLLDFPTNNFEQRMQLRSIAEASSKIISTDFIFDLDTYAQADLSMFIELLELIQREYANAANLPLEEYSLEIAQPVLYHLTWLQSLIEVEKEKAFQAFQASIADTDLNTNDKSWKDFAAEVRNRLQKNFDDAQADFEGSKARLQVLNDIIARERYSFNDPGDNERIDILETYNEIVKIIYGKTGKRFLRYIYTEAKDYIDQFEEAYKDFSAAHLRRNEEVLNDQIEELRACQNADYLIKAYNNTAYYSEVGHDFLITNLRIFHDYVPQTRRIVVVPIGSSSAAYLQDQSTSTLYAKAIIQGEDVSKEERREFLGRRSFGRTMLRIIESEEGFQAVQDYWILNNCSKKFQ